MSNQTNLISSKPKSKLSHNSLVTTFHLNKPFIVKSLMTTPKNGLPFNFNQELLPEEMVKNMPQFLPQLFSKWYLKVRFNYIDQLEKLHKKYHTSIKSFFLSIDYLDRVMTSFEKNIIKTNKYSAEIITIAVFLIAKKFNEIDCEQIKMSNYTSFKGNNTPLNVDVDILKSYEVKCLKRLNYDLNRITVYDFLMMFLNERNSLTNQKDIFNVRKNQHINDCIGLLKDLMTKKNHLFMMNTQPQIALGILFVINKIDKEVITARITKNKMINTIRTMYKYDIAKVIECMQIICDNNILLEDNEYSSEDDKQESPKINQGDLPSFKQKVFKSEKKTTKKPKLNFILSARTTITQFQPQEQTTSNRGEYEENTKYVSPKKKKNNHVVTFSNSMKKPNKKQSNGRISMYSSTECTNNYIKNKHTNERDYFCEPPSVILPKIRMSNKAVSKI